MYNFISKSTTVRNYPDLDDDQTLRAYLEYLLKVIFAGFANQVMKISFNTSEATIGLAEKAGLVWPQYVLLLTSLVLCFWIPDSLYQTIMNAVTSVSGGF